jgi:predicted nucleic acid-binding protein
MGLMDSLGRGPVALDTAVFIYFIEEHPDFLPLVTPLFAEIAAGRMEIVTSAVTLLEILVVPYRAGNLPLAERYEGLLTRSRGVRLVEINRLQIRASAQLRARYSVRTPDALQLAAALSHRCTAFVTNDRALPEIPGLAVLRLNHFRKAGGR